MKLFLREHMLLIIMQVLQLAVILSIYWLDGYHSMRLAFYAFFLGLFFLGCYLAYQYYSRRRFYNRLSNPLASLDESFQRTEQAPVSEALDRLLIEQYRLYQKQIHTLTYQQEQHLTFMDQWVHQMKTPLSVIELTAQSLDEPDSSNIREETERMKTGLHTILYMARLRSIEQDFHIKPVALSKIIHDVNGENKRFYIRNQVYPQLREEREGITVESDEKWLFFMLSQLIHNAVKYSKGKSGHIVLSVYEQDGEAVLGITDFGVGIPVSDQKRIFDAFYTGENGRVFRESTGMGLYLTKEAAEHLGHRIEVESAVGEGTTFRIIFSAAQNLTSM
ncbi:sensor histidine kinase [Bacillus thermotolerans]|uniref:histidine kinase n=1 Tax=Bacillus thermotolerans TaxID=1221996 RepID=A0A0F5HQK7_BACTR|nr:sensor histidine kinase [Bacillus thermotolerans]KKB35533.1 Two-component sensor kinase YvcQ [Bacillus thermotolerans]KKB36057.1 Two-component sensor kinase YvcQ [Bacillus thermotolerans]KKB42697.1 Two-component sensor kinase YvcQ [Bacillus thermotolerans]